MRVAIDSYCYHRYFGEQYPGLETAPEHSMTIENFLDRAVAHGVDAVSIESFMLDDPGFDRVDDIRRALADRALTDVVWAWGHPDGLGSGTHPHELDDLLRHIEIAQRVGARVMRICAGGRRTRVEPWDRHRSLLVPLLEEAADFAAQRGVELAVENHVDLLVPELLELIDLVNSPSLGVCLDTANNLRMLEDPARAIAELAPFAKAVHLKDIQAFRGAPTEFGFWPSVPLGHGLIDIPAALRELRSHSFSGLLALEIDYLHPNYGTEDDAITASLHYLRTLLVEDLDQPDNSKDTSCPHSYASQ